MHHQNTDLAEVGVLLEQLPAIETVEKNVAELNKGRTTGDKQLAKALYRRFVEAFLANVGSEVDSAKQLLDKLEECLKTLEEVSDRLNAAAREDGARFAEIDAEQMDGLVTGVVEDATESLSNSPTLPQVLLRLDAAAESLHAIEEGINDLAEIYGQLTEVIHGAQE